MTDRSKEYEARSMVYIVLTPYSVLRSSYSGGAFALDVL